MAEEKLTAEELANDIPDDIVDDIKESPANYEVLITSEDNNEFTHLADTGYIDVEEAKKSFEFFSSRVNCADAGIKLPDEIKHFYVNLEMVVDDFDILLERKEII